MILSKNPKWLPSYGNANDQMIFSPEQEKQIGNMLSDLAEAGIPLPQTFIREIVMIYYRSLLPSQLHNPKITQFNRSRKFLTALLSRLEFSRRRAH